MEQFSISGYTGGTYLMCLIDGADIVQFDVLGGRQVIGKTSAAYAELEATTQEYYDRLVELGVITPPKTQEELMAEMQSAMADMANTIKGLNAQIKEMRDGGCSADPIDGRENVPVSKHSGRGEPRRESDERDGGHA